MTRVLVVRLGSLGDLVHTVPAVVAIARAHPGAEIDWLVDAVHAEFLELVPVITRIIRLPAGTLRAWREVSRTLRARRYDVAVDFQGLIKSAALARLSGSAQVIGFDRAALREPAAAPFYSQRVAVGKGRHVIEKNLALAAAIGADPAAAEFAIRAVPSPALAAIQAHGHERFALINPGAAWPNKRWPADRYGGIANWLRGRFGLSSVVLWGPGEEALAAAVVAASNGAATLAPPTNLVDLVAICRAAVLMLSGDTGPTHVAGAVNTPIVALFGPTTPQRNGPWRSDDVSLSRYDDCACHYRRRCRRDPGGWCLGRITEEDVQLAIVERFTTASGAPVTR